MHVLMVSLDTTVLTPTIADARERHDHVVGSLGVDSRHFVDVSNTT